VLTNYADGRGGISFLGLEDFRQVAPVVSGAGNSPSLAASVKSSQSWKKKFRVSRSNSSICSVDDPEYTRIIDDIGEDFSGERRCFIEVQIPNTTKIHCLPRITLSFNPEASRLKLDSKSSFELDTQGLTLQSRLN